MKYLRLNFIILVALFFVTSCKKLVDIDPPKTSLVTETVFETNDQATAAVIGMYVAMRSNYANGGLGGVGVCVGFSSDEITDYNDAFLPYYENELTPNLANLESLYYTPYQSVYTSNSILEGLSKSSGVTPPVKAQLKGEALFIRAFSYFYLVNLFGEVPLQLSTDYQITKTTPKAMIPELYQQIVTDLKDAEGLLQETYPTSGRVRPNKTTAQAMLARVYLYEKDWVNAEKYSSLVIEKKDMYSLTNYDGVFIANSKEAIFQIEPAPNENTQEGLLYIPADLTIPPSNVSLSETFANNAFENNDQRKIKWVHSYTNSAGIFYYPFKYKIRSSTTITEYSMVLRLGEQYLIRAEAKINQGKLSTGIDDLNIIRLRTLPDGSNANTLQKLPQTLSQNDALLAVEKERKVELFSEWGHRWFDLKRTGKVDQILAPIKVSWQSTDALYPIPQSEISRNPKITQNKGY